MPIIGPERNLVPETLLDPEFQSHGAQSGLSWWAMYTRSRQEKELMRRLGAVQGAFYCPIVPNHYRSPTGRSRTSYLPLFTNYVFVFGDESQRYEAVATGCVSKCLPVKNGDRLAADLRQLRQLIESGVPVTAESQIEAGDRVRIKSGSMLGLEGLVFKRHGQSRLLVIVDFLQQGASIELPDWEVERL
jgi:transcription antitermination factor NusG